MSPPHAFALARSHWVSWLAVLATGLGLNACAASPASTWAGVVTHVSDGDTVYVRLSGQQQAVPVRILGIDAPESCQPGGQAAQQALEDRLLREKVSLVSHGHDSYGRELAQVYWQGQDMGRWMVSQGHAWSYRQGKNPGPYIQEQKQAQRARRGIFAQGTPETPRHFRQRHGSCRTGS